MMVRIVETGGRRASPARVSMGSSKRRTNVRLAGRGPNIRTRDYQKAPVPMWTEVLFGAELVLLHLAPVYYGLGTPHGHGSGVVFIPGFLCPDHYLFPLQNWLRRIGYQAFFSGIDFNAECPNLLIKRCLNETIEKALAKTGRRFISSATVWEALSRARSRGNGHRTSLLSLRWVRRSVVQWLIPASCAQPRRFASAMFGLDTFFGG